MSLRYGRNHFHDPSTGRFTQEDPIGLAGGLNLYGFAGGDPVSYGDPYGLCAEHLRDKKGFCPGGSALRIIRNLSVQSHEFLDVSPPGAGSVLTRAAVFWLFCGTMVAGYGPRHSRWLGEPLRERAG